MHCVACAGQTLYRLRDCGSQHGLLAHALTVCRVLRRYSVSCSFVLNFVSVLRVGSNVILCQVDSNVISSGQVHHADEHRLRSGLPQRRRGSSARASSRTPINVAASGIADRRVHLPGPGKQNPPQNAWGTDGPMLHPRRYRSK